MWDVRVEALSYCAEGAHGLRVHACSSRSKPHPLTPTNLRLRHCDALAAADPVPALRHGNIEDIRRLTAGVWCGAKRAAYRAPPSLANIKVERQHQSLIL